MISIGELPLVLSQIERERGIKKEVIIDALKSALLSALRRVFDEKDWESLSVVIDEESGELKVLKGKKDVTPSDEAFGRLAAQSAKQVIMQRIREAEKNSIFDEFQEKEGSVVTGTVQRIEGRNYLINLGRIEALLFPSEQIFKEKYSLKDRIRVYIKEARKTAKGPVLLISRTHPGLLKYLMETEIPEIHDEVIEIKSIAREPGRRAKVAVYSKDPQIGAVGTCVGHMGQRIQSIVRELSDERIDVIEWSEDPKILIANALKPAKIAQINLDEAEKTARVFVSEDQLSLAIGKGGQNIRLASRLTSWHIDVCNVNDSKEVEKDEKRLSLKEKIVLAKSKKNQEEKENKETKEVNSDDEKAADSE